MNTEVISKAAYSNGLQENGQDGVVFTMPASRKKFMSVYIRPDIDTLVFQPEIYRIQSYGRKQGLSKHQENLH